METKQPVKHGLLKCLWSFWLKHGTNVFVAFGILIAALTAFCVPCGSLIHVIGVIAAILSGVFLKFANVPIRQFRVCLGWGCITYTLFVVLSHICAVRGLVDEHYLGVFLAAAVCFFLYVYIPMLSYALRLNDQKYGTDFFSCNDTDKNNGILVLIMYVIMLAVCSGIEEKRLNDALLAREQFTPVIGWTTEIQHGNTYYVVTCSKGKLWVSPVMYPQVRNISFHSRVRFVGTRDYNGLIKVRRFEILDH